VKPWICHRPRHWQIFQNQIEEGYFEYGNFKFENGHFEFENGNFEFENSNFEFENGNFEKQSGELKTKWGAKIKAKWGTKSKVGTKSLTICWKWGTKFPTQRPVWCLSLDVKFSKLPYSKLSTIPIFQLSISNVY